MRAWWQDRRLLPKIFILIKASQILSSNALEKSSDDHSVRAVPWAHGAKFCDAFHQALFSRVIDFARNQYENALEPRSYR